MLAPRSVAHHADFQPYTPGAFTGQQVVFSVQAGFASPAEDYATRRIDLLDQFVTHPQATFFFRVRGKSMIGVGIDDGDTLVVNRALIARSGQVVVAVVDNEFTVKTLMRRGRKVWLHAENPTFPDIVPRDGQTIEVWGVCTGCLKPLPR